MNRGTIAQVILFIGIVFVFIIFIKFIALGINAFIGLIRGL